MTIETESANQADMYANFFYRLINESSFVYALTKYSSYLEIEDPEFHKLRTAYLNAAKALEDYVNENSNEEED